MTNEKSKCCNATTSPYFLPGEELIGFSEFDTCDECGKPAKLNLGAPFETSNIPNEKLR